MPKPIMNTPGGTAEHAADARVGAQAFGEAVREQRHDRP